MRLITFCALRAQKVINEGKAQDTKGKSYTVPRKAVTRHINQNLVMVVVVAVRMFARTGRVIGLSAARLAMIATASLPQHHPPPQVAGELADFLRQRHRLVEVGQEI